MQDQKELADKFAKAADALSLRRARAHDHNTPPDQRYNTFAHMAHDFVQLAPELLVWAAQQMRNDATQDDNAARRTVTGVVAIDALPPGEYTVRRHSIEEAPGVLVELTPESALVALRNMTARDHDGGASVKVPDAQRYLQDNERLLYENKRLNEKLRELRKTNDAAAVDKRALAEENNKLREALAASSKTCENLQRELANAKAGEKALADEAFNQASTYWRSEYMKLHNALRPDVEFTNTVHTLRAAQDAVYLVRNWRHAVELMRRLSGWTITRQQNTIQVLMPNCTGINIPIQANDDVHATLLLLLYSLLGSADSLEINVTNT